MSLEFSHPRLPPRRTNLKVPTTCASLLVVHGASHIQFANGGQKETDNITPNLEKYNFATFGGPECMSNHMQTDTEQLTLWSGRVTIITPLREDDHPL
ncbi:hypothetical protein BT63DRAFT_426808 [Microthyrium microscopicum]|uniref:Uncharacterized protein n=1 Tax=Microthyrium microscopicum TaxID=703497 RepID=A0A6A6U8N3_9PEZI|nr:hypothetical protein BT63DRAFT_426808 [Microthyrium microscopicum]